ncbi:MAG: FAD-binding oxidoreductase [Gammaproteobacteria bacterium]|nr:FAD-binding oxidoreductase [Gammaproteobacteria bacterium]
MSAHFTDDFKTAPFWWERTPRPDPKPAHEKLPQRADVVIVGSGYTGLHAAVQTAPRRSTVVLDAEDAGWGCSTRNGGQVSTSLKPSFAALSGRFGARAAMEILQEGNRALEWVGAFTAENNIDCDFRRCGRFFGAHSRGAFSKLQKRIDAIPRELGADAYTLTRGEQRAEIASDFYHGGAVWPKHASLDPARYHRGLLDCARKNGAQVFSHCAATGVARAAGGRGFEIQTARGVVHAADLVIATSGYTGAPLPPASALKWMRRRIIPVASYIIATEELPAETAAQLFPGARVVTDSRRLVVYYRLCPRRRRVLFGGRVSAGGAGLREAALRLRRQMLRIFPQLAGARISHSWMGLVGYTFDELPHLGAHDGVHYAMGYCGSGISLASYCGMKTGLRVLGDARGETALARPPFQARMYYRRRPWFLPPAVLYYRWRDEMEVRRG